MSSINFITRPRQGSGGRALCARFNVALCVFVRTCVSVCMFVWVCIWVVLLWNAVLPETGPTRRARKRPKIETEEGTKLFFFSYHNRFAIVVVNGGTAFARLKCHAVFIFSQLLPRMVFHSKVNETHDFPGPYGTVVDTVREN